MVFRLWATAFRRPAFRVGSSAGIKMIVALDATPLTVATGGVARYTGELAVALAKAFQEDTFWMLSDQCFELPFDEFANLRKGEGPRTAVERKWWLWGLVQELSRRHADVFHGTDFAVPYLPLRPSVMTLHDLSPWRDPAWHADADRVRRRTPLLLRAGLATMVITPSDVIRKEAIEQFRLAPERVISVPLAASEHFRPAVNDGNQTPRRKPYFLFVGTLEPRKNLPVLVEAWRTVRSETPVDLVIAGRRRADFVELAAEEGLVIEGPVEERDLPALYSNAAAVIYPSLYEGFGLPVLEAMQSGAVVIASRDPALMEVSGGEGALHVDAQDAHAWAEALRAALAGSLGGLRDAALKRAASFSWQKTAIRTHEVYLEARRRFRHKR